MTADTRTTDRPAGLGAHELVLLHGQPGSPADWQPVTARLPTQLHASPPAGRDTAPASRRVRRERARRLTTWTRAITRAVLVGHSYGGGALAAAALAPRRVEA
jgi:pimeloyl-ACP methyl ester carboxylesterase